jgi:hypothetical protein
MSRARDVSAVVPVKDLRGTKSRLAPILDPGARAGLTLYMMGRVVRAIAEAGVEDVCVVSPDRIVLEEAKRRGATPLVQESCGLNPSKRAAAGRWGSVPRRSSCSLQTFRSSMRMMFGRYCRRRVRALRRLSPPMGCVPVRTRSSYNPPMSCPSPSGQTASRPTLGLPGGAAWTSGSASGPTWPSISTRRETLDVSERPEQRAREGGRSAWRRGLP